jgi:chemotaxis receptor (MCP) glutamine deamidase CheD
MNNFPKVTVEIGDFFATDSPALITTSLGACVSVTMFDPVMKIGGMNHIVLPGTFIENDYIQMFEEEDSRYGIFSMEKLLYKMESLGATRKNIQVKIFGASLLDNGDRQKKSSNETTYNINVQKQNVEFVKAFLSMARLKIQEELIFQKEALRITLNTFNGEVEVKRIKNEFRKSVQNLKNITKFWRR